MVNPNVIGININRFPTLKRRSAPYAELGLPRVFGDAPQPFHDQLVDLDVTPVVPHWAPCPPREILPAQSDQHQVGNSVD